MIRRFFLVAVAVIFLASCTPHNAILREERPIIALELVGSWKFEDGQGTFCLLHFGKDGMFDGYLVKNSNKQAFSGTWQLREDRIVYGYATPGSVAGVKDEDKIIELKPKYFVIEARDGGRRQYNKMRSAE